MRIATIGDVSANLAKFRDGQRLLPIRVELDPAFRTELSALEILPVPGHRRLAVPLAAVADLELGAGPSSIERYDRVRRVLIGADLAPGEALGAALARVYALPEARNLPAGRAHPERRRCRDHGRGVRRLRSAMGAGLMMVLAVLVLLFGDVFQPITILLSLPLSLGGVILALLLTGQPLSHAGGDRRADADRHRHQERHHAGGLRHRARAAGTPRRQAITDAGAKRARPIVMTTVAMVAGMVPSALGIGDGGEFRAPMAIGVIGGLIVSTLLSLVFVPSFYTVMDDLSQFVRRAGRRRVPDGRGQPAE